MFIRSVLSSLVVLFGVVAWANVQPGPQRRTSLYYYFELPPKEKLVLKIGADKVCKNGSDKIAIEEFDSSKSYPSAETKKPVPIRIKHFYVESFSICSNQPIGKLSETLTIGPFTDQMTHIRITTSEGIKIDR